MRLWKNLSYSISGAIFITAICFAFYSSVLQLLADPGIILEGWVNLLIILLSDDTYTSLINTWPFFNVLFYSVVIFIGLSLLDKLRA